MAAAIRPRIRRRRNLGAGAVRFAVVGAFLVFILLPLYWMVMTSIKPSSD